MKAQTYSVEAGWRVFSFLSLEFSDGIVGWSEFTVSNSLPRVLSKAITELANLIDENSRENIRETVNKLRLLSRQSEGGIVQQAISAIENALWDAKAKSLQTSVISLLGGKIQELPVYWSHFGTTRVRAYQHVNQPSLQRYDDIELLIKNAVDSRVCAIKTNIFIDDPEPYIYMPGFGRQNPNCGGTYMSFKTRDRLRLWLKTLREALPNSIEIGLDINFNYSNSDLSYIHKLANELDLAWIELDNNSLEGYAVARSQLRNRISTGENFTTLEMFMDSARRGLVDIYGIDCQWFGLSRSLCAAEIVKEYGCLVSPHNFNGHLSTHIAASLACLVDNFYLLEYDYDDVPWRDELFNVSGSVKNGRFVFHDSVIGWGAEPKVKALEKYASRD